MLTLSDLQSHLPEINRLAPKPVSLILVVLIAYSLSQLVWQISVPPPRIETSATSASGGSPSKPQQTQPDFGMEIARYHLFGLPPAIAASQAFSADQAVERETTLPLKLLGIYASKNDDESLAIIDTGKEEKVFGIGDSITGGATLHRVARDRVILERNGVLESLLLPKEDALDIGAPPPAATSAWQTTDNLPQAVTANSFSDLRVEILNSPRKLQELARFQPFEVEGQMRGFQVFPKSKQEMFQQLGIESGDVVTSVNGIALDQPEKGIKALRELAKATQVTLTVERGGSQIVVQHNVE